MPKKQKKPLNKKPLKKPKLKNVVNVKINIDKSKKPTVRRASTKAPPQQPFVNFPSYQPTRIQQLEPKQQFNNADLTKTMDEYQKQFKTYLETKDKDVKALIEKFDDTLKKNIAPPKKERSQPGAYDAYADDEGQTVFESDKPKKDTWANRNELKRNTMAETDAEPLSANQVIEEAEAKAFNVEEAVRGLGSLELKEGISEAKNMLLEGNVLKQYEDYVSAYKQYYGNDDYEKKRSAITAQAWALKKTAILNKIKEFGTYEEQLTKEAEMKEAKELEKAEKKEKNKRNVENKRQSKKNKKQQAALNITEDED